MQALFGFIGGVEQLQCGKGQCRGIHDCVREVCTGILGRHLKHTGRDDKVGNRAFHITLQSVRFVLPSAKCEQAAFLNCITTGHGQ